MQRTLAAAVSVPDDASAEEHTHDHEHNKDHQEHVPVLSDVGAVEEGVMGGED